MTEQERLEYIKILHDEANEIGKNGVNAWEEKISVILNKLFYQAHTDFLIKQAEEKIQLEERVEELEKYEENNLKHIDQLSNTLANKYNDIERYKQALEEILFAGPIELVREIARQALKGDTHA